jgi:deleted-in-malignant-brain-tumors protein 1
VQLYGLMAVLCPLINCTSTANCSRVSIRLKGGWNDTFGRIEVCIAGRWGTVCDDRWRDVNSEVACRELGFSSAGAMFVHSGFFNGLGEIWLTDVSCTGLENNIINCPHAIANGTCHHGEDVGAYVKILSFLQVRKIDSGRGHTVCYGHNVECLFGGFSLLGALNCHLEMRLFRVTFLMC